MTLYLIHPPNMNDFLYSMLQDLTIIKAPNSSLIFLLLKPKLTNASVLALSRNFK